MVRRAVRTDGSAWTSGISPVNHEPFLQAEVLSGGKVVRATGDGRWEASFTGRVRKAQRYSAQRAQTEVYEVPRQARSSLVITNCPAVKLLERGAPYPTFEIDRTYHPTRVLSVKMRTDDHGKVPYIWNEKASYLGRTYPDSALKYLPTGDWWKRAIEAKEAVIQGEAAKIDAAHGIRYEGAINNTGFLRLKVNVTKPGRLLVGFDEILVNGKLDFMKRLDCNNVILWDVKEPGVYGFESFEPYTFKFAEVIMLEGEATVENLEMRTYKNPNATRVCMLNDPEERKIFEAARETFAQNAVDVRAGSATAILQARPSISSRGATRSSGRSCATSRSPRSFRISPREWCRCAIRQTT